MSLVYEALQKAAQENKRSAGQVPHPVTPSPAPPAPLPVAPPRSPAIWITGLSLVAFAVVVGVAIVVAKKQISPVAPVSNSSPVTAAAPESSATAPVPIAQPRPVPPAAADATANDPRFRLTGIMQLGANYSAVINGHVVATAQYVDGAIVKSGERDRVTLNVDGRDVVVRLF